jgi:outer membrane immunogenic protein
MRKPSQAAALVALLMTSTVANAADMQVAPLKAASGVMPALFNWTGIYVGGNLGGAWAHQNWTDTTGVNFSNGNSNGAFIGGGQVGANYQFNNFVIGVEGDFDWAANRNNGSNGVLVPLLGQTVQVISNDTWIATLAGRVGWAWDRVLFYGKGGGGWVGSNGLTVTDLTTGGSITSSNFSSSGWLVGGGVEWAFTGNWTVKVEYDYLWLGAQKFTVPSGSPFLINDVFATSGINIQTFKVGVNYLFNCCGRY